MLYIYTGGREREKIRARAQRCVEESLLPPPPETENERGLFCAAKLLLLMVVGPDSENEEQREIAWRGLCVGAGFRVVCVGLWRSHRVFFSFFFFIFLSLQMPRGSRTIEGNQNYSGC